MAILRFKAGVAQLGELEKDEAKLRPSERPGKDVRAGGFKITDVSPWMAVQFLR